MRVSVVLCTYTLEMYGHFIEAAESIRGQTYDDLELVVVVDGSREVYERVEDEYGDVKEIILHMNDTNLGLLSSRNVGAELASGDVVAFIDDDSIADEQWIAELVRTYEETGAIAAGGKIVGDWVAGKPTFLPEEYYWLVGVTYRGFTDQPGEVRNTFGSNISFRRDVFLDLGGFDTDIGGRKGDANLQGGETELCARLWERKGRGVMYNPEALVHHKVFEWRIRKRWLAERAFWQGYSKATISQVLSGRSSKEESDFLYQLIVYGFPKRLRVLVLGQNGATARQLIALVLLTAFVGAGYLYGTLKARLN